MRQCANWIADHDAAMIEDFLEFRGGVSSLFCGKIGFTTHRRSMRTERSHGREARLDLALYGKVTRTRRLPEWPPSVQKVGLIRRQVAVESNFTELVETAVRACDSNQP